MNILTHILAENDHGVTLHLLHGAAQVMASLKWPCWHMAIALGIGSAPSPLGQPLTRGFFPTGASTPRAGNVLPSPNSGARDRSGSGDGAPGL